MTPRTIQTSLQKKPTSKSRGVESLRYTEEELNRRFDIGMAEVRAGRGVVKSLDELKAIAARIAAEP